MSAAGVKETRSESREGPVCVYGRGARGTVRRGRRNARWTPVGVGSLRCSGTLVLHALEGNKRFWAAGWQCDDLRCEPEVRDMRPAGVRLVKALEGQESLRRVSLLGNKQ
jgi:hypothetical protein